MAKKLKYGSLAFLMLLGSAFARTIAVGSTEQASSLDTKVLAEQEMLAVWGLPRLGIAVRNDPNDIRLVYGEYELRYSPATGWSGVGIKQSLNLAKPQSIGGSLYVPLEIAYVLGIKVVSSKPELLSFAAPISVPKVTLPPSLPIPATTTQIVKSTPAAASPPEPPTPTPVVSLDVIRASKTTYRSIEVQRIVLEFNKVPQYQIDREKDSISILLSGVSAANTDTKEAPENIKLTPSAEESGSGILIDTSGGSSRVFTLSSPFRIVIDTAAVLSDTVPPPIDPDNLPDGVSYKDFGKLQLLSFDPALYQAKVVSAPFGKLSDIAGLVKSSRGVAGVNGGYFDTRSALPVDLIVQSGLMTAPSLERRATVGITSAGDMLFGYPKPRYVLSGDFGSVTVNTVSSTPKKNLLTAFVGDGVSQAGADDMLTVYTSLGSSSIQSARTGRVIPPVGTLAFSFDPSIFTQLPRSVGSAVNVSLEWKSTDAPWISAVDAISAGPLLVSGGKVSLDPAKEKFDTSANIWRSTRQVAVGSFGGKPTIAYFTSGTPEAFAAALAEAGVKDAVRMDSGSSAQVYLEGGYGNLGGYLNTVWSQSVPNAIVFVPRSLLTKRKP